MRVDDYRFVKLKQINLLLQLFIIKMLLLKH